MTYTFTYTLITHKWEIYKNNKVVTSMTYNVKCDRNNSGTVQTADLGTFSTSFTKESYDEVHPQHPPIEGYTVTARTDFTPYDSLTIPGDLMGWAKSLWEDDANELAAMKSIVDYKLDGE